MWKWVIICSAFGAGWTGMPEGKGVSADPQDSAKSYIFPFDSATYTRYGYVHPDTLVSRADDLPKSYRKHCEGYKQYLQHKYEIDGYRMMIKPLGLPANAVIIEVQSLASAGYPNRALVLWMVDPWVFIKCNNKYRCPEYTMGSHYLGRTRLSLVDVRNKAVINTLGIRLGENKVFSRQNARMREINSRADYFFIPFSIGSPNQNYDNHLFRYYSQGASLEHDGKAMVLYLKDVNQDGKRMEVVFYNQLSCFTCMTTVFGYSPKNDKLVNYTVNLQEITYGQNPADSVVAERNALWVDNLFLQQAVGRQHWHYYNNYLSNGGYVECYDVRYNDSLETFQGRLELRPSW